ncbi:MAG: M56 family metallopeptidase [Fimbriimonas sp.]
MTRDLLLRIAFQSGGVFVAIWLVFRAVPSLSASAKAWIWRLAFLKPLASLLPLAAVTLYVLPASPFAAVPESSGIAIPLTPPLRADSTPSRPDVDPLLLGWSIGVCLLAGYGLSTHFRTIRIARNAQKVTAPDVLATLDELARRAEVAAPIQLLVSPTARSAMLLGGRRPAILLPSKALDERFRGDLRLMLAHEVAHLARRDLLWFAAIWCVQTLFFFNPLIWLAAHRARLDHESATDWYASRLADVQIHVYADMLLRATVVARPALVPGTVPMAESQRTIHQRLEAMKYFDSRPTLLRKVVLGTVAAGTLCALPNYVLAEPSIGPGTPGVAGGQKASSSISLKFDGIEIRPALRRAFAAARRSYKVDPNLRGIVRLTVANVELDVALQNMLRQVDGTYRIERGVYIITARRAVPTAALNAPNSPWWTPPALPAGMEANRSEPKIKVVKIAKVEFDRVDLREALRQLFMTSGNSYSIDPDVQGTVSMKLEDIDFEEALKRVVREGKCTYRIDKGVFLVKSDRF